MTQGRREEGFRQINDVFRDAFSDQQLGALVSKVVAVVSQDVVSLGSESGCDFSQEVHEHIFGDLRDSEGDCLCWLAERSLAGLVVGNSAAKVVLFAVDNDASVPNAVYLDTDHLFGHGFGHSLGQVVYV